MKSPATGLYGRSLRKARPAVGLAATVRAADFGGPQWRPRLILLASRRGTPAFPATTNGGGGTLPDYSTVRDWIGDLPPIGAGERHPDDPDHQASKLSSLNLERIRRTPEGGGRADWPSRLRLGCHDRMLRDAGVEGHSDVYGRLSFDKPASGLTTRCVSYSNGRFGHPVRDRAISLREAARLQTFPASFRFEGGLGSKARQVGNAVPPLLAERFGLALLASEKRRLKSAPGGRRRQTGSSRLEGGRRRPGQPARS